MAPLAASPSDDEHYSIAHCGVHATDFDSHVNHDNDLDSHVNHVNELDSHVNHVNELDSHVNHVNELDSRVDHVNELDSRVNHVNELDSRDNDAAILTSTYHLGTPPALGEGSGVRADRQPVSSCLIAIPFGATHPCHLANRCTQRLPQPGMGRG